MAGAVQDSWRAGGTVRVDFHVAPKTTRSGRDALSLSLSGDLGATLGGANPTVPPGSSLAGGVFLGLGSARY